MPERLHDIGLQHGTDKATFHGYCDFYQEHLPAKVGRLLEIGVMDGASLQMWRDYYPYAEIVGVDINPKRPIYGAKIWHGDATDSALVAELTDLYVQFDVIIDDGSHMTADQQRTFELLWPAVAAGGQYIIEDLHTSYMSNYVNSPQTTIEWLAGSGLDVTMFARAQGEPATFIRRHGFDAGHVVWSGLDAAESITAIIQK